MLRFQEANCSTSAAFHTQPLVRCPPAGGTGSPHGFCSQQAHGGHKRAMTVAFHSVAARTGEAIRREHLFALDAATPNCCQERQMHLHSELLCGCVFSDLRRLTFDLSRDRRLAGGRRLEGRVSPHFAALNQTKHRTGAPGVGRTTKVRCARVISLLETGRRRHREHTQRRGPRALPTIGVMRGAWIRSQQIARRKCRALRHRARCLNLPNRQRFSVLPG